MKRWFQAASALVLFAAAACGEPTAARTAPSRRADLTPLSVSISGPSHVRTNVTCTWTASVSGGTAPYTYDWVGGYGGYYNLAQSYQAYFPSTDGLSVIVEDANGQIAQGNLGVFASPAGPLC